MKLFSTSCFWQNIGGARTPLLPPPLDYIQGWYVYPWISMYFEPPIFMLKKHCPRGGGGADYAHQILLAPLDFQTFLRLWSKRVQCVISGFQFSVRPGIIIYFLIIGNQQPVMIQQPMAMAPPGYTMEPNGYTSEKYWEESLDWKEQYLHIPLQIFNIYYLGVIQ